MKITIVLGAFFPVPPVRGGAVEKSWFALAKEFARRGHEVTLVSRWLPGLAENETEAGVHHLRVRSFETPRSLAWLKFLDLLYSLRARRVLTVGDVLVTNTFWLPILVRDDRWGKVLVSVGRTPRGQMKYYANAAGFLAPSQAIAEAIARECPGLVAKTKVIPYPAPAVHGPIQSWTARPRTILYLGRVHPEKGLHLLVGAFANLDAPGWNLRVVGPAKIEEGGGGEDYLRKLQALAGNSPAITFCGPVFDPNELAREFVQARIFVYPSLAERGETFGLAPLEAMTHGCAVLVSNLACFRDFVIPKVTGFVFDHTSAKPSEALRAKLREMTSEDEMVERIAGAGEAKAEEFSVAHVAEKLLEDFASLP